MQIELKYAQAHRTRHGKIAHYFCKPGMPRARLRGEPLSREFMECYWAAIEAAPALPVPKFRLRGQVAVIAPRAAATQVRRAAKTGGAIYFIQGATTQNIKIGFSANPLNRLKELATGSAERLLMLGAIPGTRSDERALHAQFSDINVKGEWFKNDRALIAYIEGQNANPSKLAIRNPWDDVA